MEERTLAHLLYISIHITKEIIISSFMLEGIVYPYTLTSLELFSILTIFENVFINLFLCAAVFCPFVCLCTMCEPGICSPEEVSAGAGKPGPLQMRYLLFITESLPRSPFFFNF